MTPKLNQVSSLTYKTWPDKMADKILSQLIEAVKTINKSNSPLASNSNASSSSEDALKGLFPSISPSTSNCQFDPKMNYASKKRKSTSARPAKRKASESKPVLKYVIILPSS
jgi:hypothetical protein